jgi:hypothetical protein
MVLRRRRSGLRYAFEVYGAVPRSSALLFLIADRGHRKWLLRKEPYLAFFFPGHFQPRNSLELPTPVGFFRLPVWQAALGEETKATHTIQSY